MSFCDWFISLNVTSSRLIRVFTCGRIPFLFKAEWYSTVCTGHVFFTWNHLSFEIGCGMRRLMSSCNVKILCWTLVRFHLSPRNHETEAIMNTSLGRARLREVKQQGDTAGRQGRFSQVPDPRAGRPPHLDHATSTRWMLRISSILTAALQPSPSTHMRCLISASSESSLLQIP